MAVSVVFPASGALRPRIAAPPGFAWPGADGHRARLAGNRPEAGAAFRLAVGAGLQPDAGYGAERRAVRIRCLTRSAPLVDLRVFADRRFALGCLLSFVLGIGLYGSVYLMPVFLAFVRAHDALEIGHIMVITGAAQLLVAPLVVWAERRADARLLTIAGFLLFAGGLAMSAFQTRGTDFDELLLPQIVRGAAIMLCLLPPVRIALGHLPQSALPNASGLFNLMRNLGGAIGLALIDTVIYGRAPVIGEGLGQAIELGSVEAPSRSACPWKRFMAHVPARRWSRRHQLYPRGGGAAGAHRGDQ